jgi:anti-sigma regulatory factor (Ser/Thr protein kinase)
MFQTKHSKNGFHVSFAATLKNIDAVVQETKKFLSGIHAQQHIFDMTLALREGLMNAVVDGSNLDADKKVSCSVLLDGDMLVIEIKDMGNGFDWRTRMGRIPPPDSESGRGLAIMGLYCDAIHYNDKGNKLTMKKDMRSSPSAMPKTTPSDP